MAIERACDMSSLYELTIVYEEKTIGSCFANFFSEACV